MCTYRDIDIVSDDGALPRRSEGEGGFGRTRTSFDLDREELFQQPDAVKPAPDYSRQGAL